MPNRNFCELAFDPDFVRPHLPNGETSPANFKRSFRQFQLQFFVGKPPQTPRPFHVNPAVADQGEAGGARRGVRGHVQPPRSPFPDRPRPSAHGVVPLLYRSNLRSLPPYSPLGRSMTRARPTKERRKKKDPPICDREIFRRLGMVRTNAPGRDAGHACRRRALLLAASRPPSLCRYRLSRMPRYRGSPARRVPSALPRKAAWGDIPE